MGINLQPVSKQVIVVTGASSGIGLATAHEAAKAGAKLVLSARNQAALSETVAKIASDGGQAIYVVADVGRRSEVDRIAETALNEFGRVDTWVNVAGSSIYGRLDEVTEEDNRRLFDTNFWGVVNGSLAALPLLKQRGGALINVGSEVSDAVVPMLGMYSTTKHAVKGFTDSLRVEIEEMDKAPVSITLIQPTAVDTPFPQHARNYMDREPKLPSPKINPEEVAKAILDAAAHHRRDVTVGASAKLNTVISKMLPSLADGMAAKQVAQLRSEKPPMRPEGTLHAPGDAGRIRGSESQSMEV